MGLFLTFSAYAQEVGVKWETGTLQEALDKAKKNKKGPKHVFVDCYTTWCGPCKFMATEVFPTKDAGDYFNKYFVNIKIDMEKGEGIDIRKKYSVVAYPTFLILDPDGNEVGRAVGMAPFEKFVKDVETALNPENSAGVLLRKYEESGKFDDGKAYVERLDDLSMKKQMGEFFMTYYDKMECDWNASFAWKYISKCLNLKNFYLIDRVLLNKGAIDKYEGVGTVNQKVYESLAGEMRQCLLGRLIIPADKIEKVTAIFLSLYDGSKKEAEYDLTIFKAAIALSQNDIEKVITIFKEAPYWNMQYREFYSLQYFFTGIEAVPAEAKREVVNMIQERLDDYSSSNRKNYFDKSYE